MKACIVSNEFYISHFLMRDVNPDHFDVIFENQFYVSPKNKTWERFKAFLPFSAGNHNSVLAFAIEDIILLDQIYREIGKPKVWLWNPISSMTSKNRKLFLSYVRRKSIEVWTFDRQDVDKYGFIFHNQIHSSSLINNEIKQNNKKRVFFSGVDKGRLGTLRTIEKKLKTLAVDVYFHVVREKSKEYNSQEIEITTDKYLSFDEYLSEVKRSDILVDIAQGDQDGITLRVIEAMFENKKLITTNLNVKKLKGYRPENVYLYGYEDRSLEAFILSPVQPISDIDKKQYTFNHLLEEMF
ncbi:hypothetical protein OFY17_00900 [Marinomonas sp. C2222]|uniref:Uncharacterized protein n=1 Tax=Marinomonas sargassi TaxID=2984494 RepID=A0ABT2YNG5_9GAMM|nr:hypothetical protein [Marinomonas sargassi]MCV2401428.1 hypothetical protein [Marinomonas sargassi]